MASPHCIPLYCAGVEDRQTPAKQTPQTPTSATPTANIYSSQMEKTSWKIPEAAGDQEHN